MKPKVCEVRFGMVMPASMLRWLQGEARKQETTASELIRRMIDEKRNRHSE